MSQIFISYSRKDLDIAKRIIDALAQYKLTPWVDWLSIPKGEEFARKIEQGIEGAEVFLFLVSPDSTKSEWCKREIDHALKNGKRILPVVLRGVTPQDAHPEISKRNWIFCRDRQDDFDQAITEIHETVHTDYEWLQYHTRLQIKALEWEHTQDKSRLLRGKELAESEERLAETHENPHPTELQRTYVLKSRRNEDAQRRRLTIGFGIGLTIVAFLAFFAWEQRNNAQKQSEVALSRYLASQAQSIINSENMPQSTAVLLAIQSMKLFPNIDAAQILQKANLLSPAAQMYHKSPVIIVSFDPNGEYVASSDTDGLIKVWKAETRKHITQYIHEHSVSDFKFSSDGMYIVSAGGPQVCVWETMTGRQIICVLHEPLVSSVAFAPDGSHIASGGYDGKVFIWDVATGKKISSIQHADDVSSLAFSPNGKRIVSGGYDNTARVWDVLSGQEIAVFSHNGYVRSVSYSPDGKFIVTGDDEAFVTVWDIGSSQKIQSTQYNLPVDTVKFSSDGNYIVSGSQDGVIQVRDTISGDEISTMLHDGFVTSVTFNPDNSLIASSSTDNTARVWDVASGDEIYRAKYNEVVSSVDFSPDGHELVVGSLDKTVHIYKLINSREIFRITLNNNVDGIATFSPTGKSVLISNKNGYARLIALGETTFDQRIVMEITEGDQWGLNFPPEFSPDGQFIISCDSDGQLRIWTSASGQEKTSIFIEHCFKRFVFSAGSRYLALIDLDNNLSIWDIHDKEEVYSTSIETLNFSFSQDEHYFIIEEADKVISVLDLSTGEFLSQFSFEKFGSSLLFTPNGEYVLAGRVDDIVELEPSSIDASQLAFNIYVLNAVNGQKVSKIDEKFDGNDSIAASPDGKHILTQNENTLCLWKLKTGRKVSCITHDTEIISIVFSPDNKHVATNHEDGSLRMWNTHNGREVAQVLDDRVASLMRFSSEGNFLATRRDDNVLQVWDWKTGQEVAIFTHGDSKILSVEFSPNDRYILLGTWGNGSRYNAYAWLWHPNDLINDACSRILQNLTYTEWKQYIGNILPYHATCDPEIYPNAIIPEGAQEAYLESIQN